MSKWVERNIVGTTLENSEKLTFDPPVSVWEAMRARLEAKKRQAKS